MTAHPTPPLSAAPPLALDRAGRRRKVSERLGRLVRGGATVVSLAAAAAAVAFWVRSGTVTDVLTVDRPDGGVDEIWTSGGTLGVRHVAAGPVAGEWRASYRESRYRYDPAYQPRMSESWDGNRVGTVGLHAAAVGFAEAAQNRATLGAAERAYAAVMGPGPFTSVSRLPAAAGPAWNRLYAARAAAWHRLYARLKVSVPLWVVAAVAAAGPAWRVGVRWWRRERARPGGFPLAAPLGAGPG